MVVRIEEELEGADSAAASSAAAGSVEIGHGEDDIIRGGGVDAITFLRRCTGFGAKPADISKLVD
jgi:hypothetical protein